MAERLFASRGFGSTTMAAIARDAGFAIQTLYNLFESKDAIREQLLVRRLDALLDEVTAVVNGPGDVRARLESTVLARVAYFSRHRDFFRLYATEVPGVVTGVGVRAGRKMAASLARQLNQIEMLFRALPARRLDPAVCAQLFHGATRAYIVSRVLHSDTPPSDAEVRSVVDALLDGLVPHR